jgi:hypothetical protein
MKSQKQESGTPPSYKGDGVAVWINQTKQGEKYLSIQILGKNGLKVNAFKFTPKPKQSQTPTITSVDL